VTVLMHIRMRGRESINVLDLVSRDVVIEADFLLGSATFHDVPEEGNELFTGVARAPVLSALGSFTC